MNPDHDNTRGTPRLPPSPLAQPVEGPPDVPLPWSTVGPAAVAGLVGGAFQGALLPRVLQAPNLGWAHAALICALSTAITGALLAASAVLADRGLPSWPRWLRWPVAMSIGGGVPVGQVLFALQIVGLGAMPRPSPYGIFHEAVPGALAGALLGVLVGVTSRLRRSAPWFLPFVALVPISTLTVARTQGLRSVLLWIMQTATAHPWLRFDAQDMGPLLCITGYPFAVLFGLALARGLRGRPQPLAPVTSAAEGEGRMDLPLPWSTPFAAMAAGLFAGLPYLVWEYGSLWTPPPAPLGRIALRTGDALVACGLVGVGLVLADRLRPTWRRHERWAAAMGLVAAIPGAAEVGCLFAGHLGHVCEDTCLAALKAAALGLGLGWAASARRGLLWRLPLTASVVHAIWCAGIRAFSLAPAGADRPFVGICVLAGLLASAKVVALGLALAERLNAARRRAMDSNRTNGDVGV